MDSKTIRFFDLPRAIILLLLLSSPTSVSAEKLVQDNYMLQFDNTDNVIVVPMIVDHSNQKEFFVNHYWGVKIVKVIVDNKKLTPKKVTPSFIDFPDQSTSTIFFNSYIYMKYCPYFGEADDNHWFLLSSEDIEDLDYGLFEFNYAIPRGSKHIQIHYQIRYADMSLSPLKIVDMWDILEKIPSE